MYIHVYLYIHVSNPIKSTSRPSALASQVINCLSVAPKIPRILEYAYAKQQH